MRMQPTVVPERPRRVPPPPLDPIDAPWEITPIETPPGGWDLDSPLRRRCPGAPN